MRRLLIALAVSFWSASVLMASGGGTIGSSSSSSSFPNMSLTGSGPLIIETTTTATNFIVNGTTQVVINTSSASVTGPTFTVGTSTLVVSGGNVGIGVTSPSYPFTAVGTLSATNQAVARGTGTVTATSGSVYGLRWDVSGSAGGASSYAGYFNNSISQTGTQTGLYGEGDEIGVRGITDGQGSVPAVGVYGSGSSGNTVGVRGDTTGTSGNGVYGTISGAATAGYAGYFEETGAPSGTRTTSALTAQRSYTGGQQATSPVFQVIDSSTHTTGSLSVWSKGGQTMVTISTSGCVLIGGATGNPGFGSINVSSGIYKNNTAYTNPDYVFEKVYTGQIVKFADHAGASSYVGPLSLDDLHVYVMKNYHLPRVPAAREIFDRTDVLLEKMEEAYLYIFELDRRLKGSERRVNDLEARLSAIEGRK
jgi:nuclear pore complex protein Nup98-Nup96